MSMQRRSLLQATDVISFGCIPRIGRLDHMVVLYLIFWGTSILDVRIYIFTNSVPEFPFLQQMNWLKNKQKNRHFSKEDMQVAKGTRRCSTLLIIRAMQITPQCGVTSHLSEWPSSKRQEETSVVEDVEKHIPSSHHQPAHHPPGTPCTFSNKIKSGSWAQLITTICWRLQN